MRVCIEATSMIGPRSGVGHSTAALVEHLVDVDPDVRVTLLPITIRGAGRLRPPRHPHVEVARTRLPARVASWVWRRATWPPAELFCGEADVVHGPNFLLPPTLKAAGVLTVHDLAFECVPDSCSDHVRSYSDTVPVMAGRAHRIIVPSEAVAEELGGWLPETAGRIRVVPQGVRDVFSARGSVLTPPRRQRLGITDPYVAYVGNLEERKNVGVLLDAFGIVRDKHPGALLVLIGSPGNGWDAIAERHADLLASDAVVQTGYLPDAEAAAIVRGASAFCYPSRYEGFGMPPVEAQAAGVPVVASDIRVLREVLGPHADFVAPDDVEGLAQAMAHLVSGGDDPARVEAGRLWASRYTWTRTATETLAVYREAVEEIT